MVDENCLKESFTWNNNKCVRIAIQGIKRYMCIVKSHMR
jgi:hypothetical protein